eukprot:SM000123S25817  [mRNA]  locus=s123:86097:87202:+ [translate_table: standard]
MDSAMAFQGSVRPALKSPPPRRPPPPPPPPPGGAPQGQDLWRKELAGLEDGALAGAGLQEDVERLRRQEEIERFKKGSYDAKFGGAGAEEAKQQGGLKDAIEKVLIADFFFILAALAWFLAGVAQRATSGEAAWLDAWLGLWGPVFQPALGVFMAAALYSAGSNLLKNR